MDSSFRETPWESVVGTGMVFHLGYTDPVLRIGGWAEHPIDRV